MLNYRINSLLLLFSLFYFFPQRDHLLPTLFTAKSYRSYYYETYCFLGTVAANFKLLLGEKGIQKKFLWSELCPTLSLLLFSVIKRLLNKNHKFLDDLILPIALCRNMWIPECVSGFEISQLHFFSGVSRNKSSKMAD